MTGDLSPRFFSLWSINDAIDLSETARQLDDFVRAGLDGIVFHPRNYRAEPAYLSQAYFDVVSEVINQAKEAGLAFWIYDDNGWPSGIASGQTLHDHPALAQRWIELSEPTSHSSLASVVLDGRHLDVVERRGEGIDYLNPDAAERFIELTYEGYRRGLRGDAFDHVEAFFDDEPEFGLGHAYATLAPDGSLPWTPELPRLFEERYGRPLLPLIGSLFVTDSDSELARIQFWELISDLLAENFLGRIDSWCRTHGKVFTGHLKGEEAPHFQVPLIGSASRVLQGFGRPGIDALERYPSNDFFPIQAASTARQFGDGRAMAEAFGGAGWGSSPLDLERYLLWLGGNGLTDFVLHLSQYRLDSAALSDWPPSQPRHLTWTSAYPEVLRRVRAKLSRAEKTDSPAVVVAPQRRVMSLFEPWELLATNIHNGESAPQTPATAVSLEFMARFAALRETGRRIHVTDERTVEMFGRASDAGLQIGNVLYESVIISDDARLDPDVRRQIASISSPLPATKSPQTSTASPRESSRPSTTTVPVTWALDEVVNAIALDVTRLDASTFCTALSLEKPSEIELTLRFADRIAWLIVDGRQATLLTDRDGSSSTLTVQESARVEFQLLEESEVAPRVWAQGFFRVTSGSQWEAGETADQLRTDGPLVIAPAAARSQPTDLVVDGYPFAAGPLLARTRVILSAAGRAVILDGVAADAVRLKAGTQHSSWGWPVDGRVRVDLPLEPGAQEWILEVLPNGYNYYGPHHYRGGDWHVVSPDQIRGRRNFADPADSPDDTHVPSWSFRRSSLPTTAEIVPTVADTMTP